MVTFSFLIVKILVFLLVEDDNESIAEKYVIDVFPTLLFFNQGKVGLRLDGKPGVGLNEKQIKDFIKSCPLPEG